MSKKNEQTVATETTVEEKKSFDFASVTSTKTYSDLATKSARIRYLHASGASRGEIAKFLNIRYQHVRNVLITPVKKEKAA